MAVLSAADRRGMPGKDFAGPGKSFPVNDANHARLAISGATRSEHAGNISPEEEARIKAKAREKLGDKGGSKDDPQRPHREATPGCTQRSSTSTCRMPWLESMVLSRSRAPNR